MEPSDEDIKQAAVEYWQDRLAKFFPTEPGPSGAEMEMFKAGVNWVLNYQETTDCWILKVDDKI